MPVQGVTATAEINPRTAADGRHPPFITSFQLPEEHGPWPEGTIMAAVILNDEALPGRATALTDSSTADIVGVLQRRVAEKETSGNIMIHGSCPAEILTYASSDGPVAATAGQIEALRKGPGIYV